MAKKKSGSAALENESHVPPILDINFEEPLFSFAAHPTQPVVLSGLATGHLFCHRYNPEILTEKLQKARNNIKKSQKEGLRVSQLSNKWWLVVKRFDEPEDDSGVEIAWKTKRHKGSCRLVLFDVREGQVGELLYSVGTDHIIKKAASETGRVTSKSEISSHFDGKDAITNLTLSQSHPFLLAGSENGHIFVFDADNLGLANLKFKVENVHEDAINKILPMPSVSAYHYLSLGSTTLAHIDIRKGIITQSDDQLDELLNMCYPNAFIDKEKNDVALVAHGEGIVSIWKNSANQFSDQLSRIKVNKNASIDAIVPTMNAGDDELKDCVWCGDSEGLLHRVNYKTGKVRETRVHSAAVGKLGGMDEVNQLDIDFEYRLVSSGMDSLKIWSDELNENPDFEHDSDNDSDSDSESDSESGSESDSGSESESGSDGPLSDIGSDDSDSETETKVKQPSSEEISDNESAHEKSESEESRPQVKRKSLNELKQRPKKRILNLNKSSEPVEPQKKTPKKLPKPSTSNHGIRKFEGL